MTDVHTSEAAVTSNPVIRDCWTLGSTPGVVPLS